MSQTRNQHETNSNQRREEEGDIFLWNVPLIFPPAKLVYITENITHHNHQYENLEKEAK
jgi:hypothetical protein